jgi:hypothetical protein
VNAALAWTTLGLKWMEMLAASGQVVAHRTSRINTPAQFLGMGSEKMSAAIDSSSAMTRQLMRFPYASAFGAWNAWARLLTSGIAPYHARATRNARRRRA